MFWNTSCKCSLLWMQQLSRRSTLLSPGKGFMAGSYWNYKDIQPPVITWEWHLQLHQQWNQKTQQHWQNPLPPVLKYTHQHSLLQSESTILHKQIEYSQQHILQMVTSHSVDRWFGHPYLTHQQQLSSLVPKCPVPIPEIPLVHPHLSLLQPCGVICRKNQHLQLA